jgi:hypothetical protein
MRKAFSLVELIFTIVIMASIFALLPRIIFATSKSNSFAMRQDAFFEGISLVKFASYMAWDQNNTQKLDILATSSTNSVFKCDDTTDYKRVGSKKSANGRVCKESLNASIIGPDAQSNYLLYDDIDDFNGSIIESNTMGKKKYELYSIVTYLSDDIFTYSGDKLTIDLNASSVSKSSTNIKKLHLNISYVGGRGRDKNITSFSYFSSNIGQFTLNKEDW